MFLHLPSTKAAVDVSYIGDVEIQLATLDSIKRRAGKLIGVPFLVATKPQRLEHRLKVAQTAVFYRLCFGECVGIAPAQNNSFARQKTEVTIY